MADRKYSKIFDANIADLDKLISTPTRIRDSILNALQQFPEHHLKNTGVGHFHNLKDLVRNISDQSINDAFALIHNQVCIFAVSALSSVIESYFVNYVNSNLAAVKLTKNIKFDLQELGIRYSFNIRNSLGQILITKDDSINFQNYDKIIEAFRKYLEREVVVDENTKTTVMFYLQCRHALVHQAGIVDSYFLKTIGTSNIKNYSTGDKIQLDNDDWNLIKTSFKTLLESILTSSSISQDVSSNTEENS